MRLFPVLLLFFSLLSCTAPGPLSNSSTQLLESSHKSTESSRGVVASAHPLASAAGLQILQEGGNAIDAAVATSFAISVLRPQSTGIGGGGFALLYKKMEGKVHALDFRERAPLKASENMYVNKDGSIKNFSYKKQVVGPAPNDGHLAVGVPGLVAGLVHMHKNHGSLALSKVMEPAIALAENGFEVYPSLSKSIQEKENLLRNFAQSRKIFLPHDKVPLPGQILVQSELAHTLRLIASQGQDIFYRGAIADSLVQEMKKGGGLISYKDLSSYKVIEHEPIEGTYRSYKLVGMPPPSSGGTLIFEILNMLSSDDMGTLKHNSVSYVHLLSEAMRRAFADRTLLGDPKFVKVPTKGLLSKDYALQLRHGIDLQKASPSSTISAGKAFAYESPSTTHLSVVDQWGNAVSTTQTINDTFGSGVTVAGMVLNNEMDDFSSKPGVPNVYGLVGTFANAIAPGKTMLSSMSPTLIFNSDNELQYVLGSPGGPRIITATLQTILNLIDFKFPLDEAVQSYRIHHQWLPDQISMEANALPEDVIKELEKMGHTVKVPSWYFGDVQAIGRLQNGNWIGVSDRRSDGQAKAW